MIGFSQVLMNLSVDLDALQSEVDAMLAAVKRQGGQGNWLEVARK